VATRCYTYYITENRITCDCKVVYVYACMHVRMCVCMLVHVIRIIIHTCLLLLFYFSTAYYSSQENATNQEKIKEQVMNDNRERLNIKI
jgi:hypothetical protein